MEKNWSVQQKSIFSFFATGKGNLVVRARAGSGKTTTIIEACGHAAHEDKILLAAFNKKIAVELSERVAKVGAKNVESKTLHALGFSYLRRQWSNVVVDADVDYDRARAACGKNAPDEMAELVRKLAALLKNCAPFATDIEIVSGLAEDFDLVPEEDWEEEGWDLPSVSKAAIKARDLATERDDRNRISFDDMIFIPLALGMVRAWYSMVVVDEAQDMNASQLMLAQKACKKSGRIVVVGDDKQAIYGFRGADADGIDRLKKELSAEERGLTTTYRCGKAIVRVAQKYVPDFEAGDSNPDGIVDSFGMHMLVDLAKPGDFVLSRTNAPLMGACLGFLKKGIRARIEGRDVAATLRAIVQGFKARSVPEFITRVGAWQGKQSARATKLRKKSARDAKVAQINDQAEMLVAMAEGCASVAEILGRTDSLFGETDPGRPVPTVVCSSVHRAKGLEADRVFIFADTIRDDSDEENNIAYVAVTRAKKHLTWVRK